MFNKSQNIFWSVEVTNLNNDFQLIKAHQENWVNNFQ